MNTPVDIDFQGMDAQPAARDAVNKQIAEFERRFGPIEGGRVVLKSPKAELPAGAPFEVNIELSLPNGRNFYIGRGQQRDRRYADLAFAINDSFKWVRYAAL